MNHGSRVAGGDVGDLGYGHVNHDNVADDDGDDDVGDLSNVYWSRWMMMWMILVVRFSCWQ